MFSGNGWLGAASKGSDLVALSPRERTALVAVSPRTLKSAYHARYELIEFAVFTLAARCQRLASLHAACMGLAGRGALLMGASGTGKSTLTMLGLTQGFDFLAEDSVFVEPARLLATGAANYLHVRADTLKWLAPSDRAAVRQSPVIRRRSGIRKFELDLRGGQYRLAAAPLKIATVVFLSSRSGKPGALLQPLSRQALLSRLTAEQAYAANQPNWRAFSGKLARLPAYELRRGAHPAEGLDALRTALHPS
jgi:hypothetical protein